MQLIIRLSIDYLTLCEALTAGAFDVVNCQYRGEFDRIFSKKSNAQGFASGGGGCLDLTDTLGHKGKLKSENSTIYKR